MTTSYKTDCIPRNLWSGDGYYGLSILGSLWKRQGLVIEKNAWPFYKWRHCGPERGWDLSQVTQPWNLKVQFTQSDYLEELGAVGVGVNKN